MNELVSVAVVSVRPEIRLMLQRYVGGILSDMAVVRSMPPEEAILSKSDLYVLYNSYGPGYCQISKKISLDSIVTVDLFPVFTGIKKVLSIPEFSRLGVLGGHIWCAADFLHQLIDMGARNYYFVTGTPETSFKMDVDWFIVPEEISNYINNPKVTKNMVIVPRTIESKSVAKLINAVVRESEKKKKCLSV